jgi:hypothetical protein
VRLKVLFVLAAFVISVSVASCDGSNNNIDMKKFIDKMHKENKVSPSKKKEIRKSIFPNLKEK